MGSEEEKKLQLEKDLAARLGSAGWADRLRQQKVQESRREKAGGEARRSRV